MFAIEYVVYWALWEGALVPLLKLPAWKIGERGFEPHSGLQVSRKLNLSSTFTRKDPILWRASVTERWRARPQTTSARISNYVSGEQCHLIHFTILKRFSWPSLAYICAQRWPKTTLISFHIEHYIINPGISTYFNNKKQDKYIKFNFRRTRWGGGVTFQGMRRSKQTFGANKWQNHSITLLSVDIYPKSYIIGLSVPSGIWEI